jgi:hypothetical protein
MYDASRAGAHQAAGGRDATIAFSDSLKQRGLVDWTLRTNASDTLIALRAACKLIHVIEGLTAPTSPTSPGARDGRARRMDLGEALDDEYRTHEFTRRRLQAEAVQPASTAIIGA